MTYDAKSAAARLHCPHASDEPCTACVESALRAAYRCGVEDAMAAECFMCKQGVPITGHRNGFPVHGDDIAGHCRASRARALLTEGPT